MLLPRVSVQQLSKELAVTSKQDTQLQFLEETNHQTTQQSNTIFHLPHRQDGVLTQWNQHDIEERQDQEREWLCGGCGPRPDHAALHVPQKISELGLHPSPLVLCSPICTHMHTHMYTHTCTHAHAHTHTHTCTHKHTALEPRHGLNQPFRTFLLPLSWGWEPERGTQELIHCTK